jgi:hypothetical protein
MNYCARLNLNPPTPGARPGTLWTRSPQIRAGLFRARPLPSGI